MTVNIFQDGVVEQITTSLGHTVMKPETVEALYQAFKARYDAEKRQTEEAKSAATTLKDRPQMFIETDAGKLL